MRASIGYSLPTGGPHQYRKWIKNNITENVKKVVNLATIGMKKRKPV